MYVRTLKNWNYFIVKYVLRTYVNTFSNVCIFSLKNIFHDSILGSESIHMVYVSMGTSVGTGIGICTHTKSIANNYS